MSQKPLIIDAGFAGMYAALSAARQHDASRASIRDLTLMFPEPTLMVRPRLYEPNPEEVMAPLADPERIIDL